MRTIFTKPVYFFWATVIGALILITAPTIAQDNVPYRYLEGVHYVPLPEAVPVQDPDKVEVVEVFWYACSHCFRLEPIVRNYEEDLADDVNFVRMPAIWQPIMEVHARIYYTAKQLGVLDTVHQGVFNAINLDRKQLKDANEVAELFSSYGVEKEAVLTAFNSADVTSQLKADYEKVRDYKITGTPQLIVHGRYRIEANQQISQNEMFKVVDFLVEKVRSEKEAQDN